SSARSTYRASAVCLVSAFGEMEHPTSQDPAMVAIKLERFVPFSTGLGGLDIRYEEFELVVQQPGVGEAWLTKLTQTLPQRRFIPSHARSTALVRPRSFSLELYRTGLETRADSCYLTVDKTNDALIDWIRQRDSETQQMRSSRLTCALLCRFTLMQETGVDVNKLFICKSKAVAHITNGGFIVPTVLGTCVQEPVAAGRNTGVVAFQFPYADINWIIAVE
ncbi:hypothetical protein BV20DRAFT_914690, partial [Pilatotrama ljubarskyi]